MRLPKRLLWLVGVGFILHGCSSMTGRTSATDHMDNQDPYSVQSMIRVIFEIERGLGTEEIRVKNKAYEAECRIDPRNPHKRFLFAFSMEDRNQAWAELSRVAKLQENFYWSYLGMAIISDGWNILDQAENNYRRAIRADPDIAIGYGHLGRMFLKSGKWPEAFPMLEKALQKDPRSIAYRLDLARAYRLAGRDRDVFNTFKKAIEIDPDNGEALSEYASLLLEKGRRDEALKIFVKLARDDPKAYKPQFEIGRLLDLSGQKEQALQAFLAACERKPTETLCWSAAARIAGELDRQEEKNIAFEKLLEIEPDHLDANKYLGPEYLRNGDLEKALPCFQAVLAKERNNIEALSGLAVVYEQGGEISRAISINHRLLSRSRDSAQAREALARLFEQFHVLPEPITGSRPDEVFARNREQIAKVYRLLLKEKPRLAGHIHIKVKVNNDGYVENVSVVRNTVGDVVIDVCSVWNMRRSKFPKGFGATYDFELSLRSGN